MSARPRAGPTGEEQKKKWDDASASMAAIPAQMGQAVDQARANCRAAETSTTNLWA